MIADIKQLEESIVNDITVIERQDKKISTSFADMAQKIKSLETGINKIRAETRTNEDANTDNDVVNAFKIDTNYVLQKDSNTRCAPGTGQWFFHHPEYQAFHGARGRQLLFVTAEAGGGKSTVMRTFVDDLQQSSDKPIVAHYFFKDEDDQLRSYEDALSSIVYQLFVQERGLVRHARSLYKQYGHGLRYRTKEMWDILIAAASEAQRNLVCVLDAIDECAPSGRRQLVSDLVTVFLGMPHPAYDKLKLVVTSRAYLDENHPYASLVVSDSVRHLAGENADVQADIQAVIRFKAEELANKRQLPQSTLDILIKRISNQNLQTRSYLAVRMTFELLDSHHLMHKGAGERTVHSIVTDIPQSLGDQFDEMLNRSPDKEHARRLFCVILAARKTLKIPELKVVYALTHPANWAIGPRESYDDLDLPTNDEGFKQLIRARCGLFITFVRNSVHLFHQTAREHLMATTDATSSLPPGSTLSVQSAPCRSERQHSWKGCITEAGANLVALTVCLDLFNFTVPISWVLGVFDSLNAGNGFGDDIKTFLEDKPLLQYAALNWYEHTVLGGDGALTALCTTRYAVFLDISKTSFWVWFFILADYICSSTTKPKAILSSVWGAADRSQRLRDEYGTMLREACLTELFETDYKVQNLLNDPSLPFCKSSSSTMRPLWRAEDGYELVDKFHLAYGEYQYTSSARAVQCVEKGQLERSKFLSSDIPTPIMIWTCISDGAPKALQSALAGAKDIEWLHEVPEHIMYRRFTWRGSSNYSGKDLRAKREKGWTAPCPPAVSAISRAINLSNSNDLFNVLADWMETSDNAKDYAQQLWGAGGFIEPSFCRRLISAGASIESQLWTARRTALQIAAALWAHDAVKTLIDLGADPGKQCLYGRTPLQWFLSGPETLFDNERHDFFSSSKSAFAKLSTREQQRYSKSCISSTLKALCRTRSTQTSPLEQTDSSGRYPLMLAARNSPTATKALLEEGAQIEQTDRWGRTAIMHFFCGGFNGRSLAILRHLMHFGANSLASDASGHTVLDYWVRQLLAMDIGSLYPGFNSYNKSFDNLTNSGALSDMNVLARELGPLRVPLSAAARLGNVKLCWALLVAGANPDGHGLSTNTSFTYQNGSKAMHLADLSWKPLFIALSQNAYTTAAVLLSHGADVTSKTPMRKRTKYNKYRLKECGTTPLHLAVAAASEYKSSRLVLNTGGLSAGCSFRVVGHPESKVTKRSGILERHAIAKRAYAKTHSYKMKFKDDTSDSEFEMPRSKFHNDWTGSELLPYDEIPESILASKQFDDPLYHVIIDREQEFTVRQQAMVELLLKKGAPVNAQTQEGITALACVDSSTDLARLLLRYGADPNIASDDGCTPLMRASQRGHRELVQVFLDAGANPDAQLNVAPLEHRECAAFIEQNSRTFRHCDAPLTAMAVAAERGHLEIVKLLLKHGAEPNLPIVHHAHGRIPSKRVQRRRARNFGESDSSDSEVEPEGWKGFISVGTALSWARDGVRELLLQNGADPGKEEPLRECDCTIIERGDGRGVFGSDDEYPSVRDRARS